VHATCRLGKEGGSGRATGSRGPANCDAKVTSAPTDAAIESPCGESTSAGGSDCAGGDADQAGPTPEPGKQGLAVSSGDLVPRRPHHAAWCDRDLGDDQPPWPEWPRFHPSPTRSGLPRESPEPGARDHRQPTQTRPSTPRVARVRRVKRGLCDRELGRGCPRVRCPSLRCRSSHRQSSRGFRDRPLCGSESSVDDSTSDDPAEAESAWFGSARSSHVPG